MSTLSPKDREVLAAAWQCFDTQPKVNYTKLAQMQGYKNAQTAAAVFNKIKGKLLAGGTAAAGAEGGEASPAGKAKGSKGKGTKRTRDEDDEEGVGEGEEVKKVKTEKKVKRAKGEDGEIVVKSEEGGEEDLL